MKLIEIAEGISVNVDKIESVVKTDNMNCMVHTINNKYKSTIPYDTLLEIIGHGEGNSMKMFNIMKQQGNFAG